MSASFGVNEAGIEAIRLCIDGFTEQSEDLKRAGDQLEQAFESLKHGLGENFDVQIENLIEAIKMSEGGIIMCIEELIELLDDMAGFYELQLERKFGGRQR